MEYTIRSEDAKDDDQVRIILREAFPSDAESRLVDALRADGKAIISLVAVSGEHVLGHILFSPVSTSPPDVAKGNGLAPVAVLPTMQSQGIGSVLIRQGLQLCMMLHFNGRPASGLVRYADEFALFLSN